MSAGDRKGFTLVELLVVVILGGFVLAATYQTLVTNQRTFTIQAAEIQGQQTLRAGMEVLSGELREISPPEGDLLAMSEDSVRIRVMRAFGVACDTATSGTPNLTVKRVGQWFSAGDSAFTFIDGDPERRSDDDWRSTRVMAVDTTTTCGSGPDEAQLVTLAGLAGADTVLPGSPLRVFEQYSYGLRDWDGQPFLVRQAPGGPVQPVVGPLDETVSDPLKFEYLNENGSVTADPLEVAQIQITLKTSSDARDVQGDLVRDSLTLRVHTRN